MRNKKCLLLVMALFAGARASGESAWAYVPASLDARGLGAIAVPSPSTEASVRLVGAGPSGLEPPVELHRVVAVDINLPRAADNDARPPGGSTECAVPEGALWPDSRERIAAVLPDPSGPAKGEVIRNPWEVRIHSKSAGNDAVFACGGIVVGGDGGPVALLNGSVVKRGVASGEFRVIGVLSNGVLLGRGGLFFVIPLGKSVTVSTVDG
jgi:hypothetical protein